MFAISLWFQIRSDRKRLLQISLGETEKEQRFITYLLSSARAVRAYFSYSFFYFFTYFL